MSKTLAIAILGICVVFIATFRPGYADQGLLTPAPSLSTEEQEFMELAKKGVATANTATSAVADVQPIIENLDKIRKRHVGELLEVRATVAIGDILFEQKHMEQAQMQYADAEKAISRVVERTGRNNKSALIYASYVALKQGNVLDALERPSEALKKYAVAVRGANGNSPFGGIALSNAVAASHSLVDKDGKNATRLYGWLKALFREDTPIPMRVELGLQCLESARQLSDRDILVDSEWPSMQKSIREFIGQYGSNVQKQYAASVIVSMRPRIPKEISSVFEQGNALVQQSVRENLNTILPSEDSQQYVNVRTPQPALAASGNTDADIGKKRSMGSIDKPSDREHIMVNGRLAYWIATSLIVLFLAFAFIRYRYKLNKSLAGR